MATETGFTLANYGIQVKTLYRNAPPGQLYELGLKNEKGTAISSSGALMAFSGEKTGRSPKDKRIVDEPRSRDHVWWGDVNIAISGDNFERLRDKMVAYLMGRDVLPPSKRRASKGRKE